MTVLAGIADLATSLGLTLAAILMAIALVALKALWVTRRARRRQRREATRFPHPRLGVDSRLWSDELGEFDFPGRRV